MKNSQLCEARCHTFARSVMVPRGKHIFIFRRRNRGTSKSSERKKEKTGPMEITEGRGGARDYPWCLKRRNDREKGPLCPSFFLPAGSRDDGVCPRGRSILLWIACESRSWKRERKRELESGVYRGAPGGTWGSLATGTLNVGGTAGAPPGCFSPAYLTYVPATFSPSPTSRFGSSCPSRPLHYHSASWSSSSFRLILLLFLVRHHLLFLFA